MDAGIPAKKGDIDRSNYTKAELEYIEWEILDWDFGISGGVRPLIMPEEAWEILKPKVNPADYPWAFKQFEKQNQKKESD